MATILFWMSVCGLNSKQFVESVLFPVSSADRDLKRFMGVWRVFLLEFIGIFAFEARVEDATLLDFIVDAGFDL